MEVYSTFAEIEIDGTPVSNYYSVLINQAFNKHHDFCIKLPHEVFETRGTFSMDKVKDLIGKFILIRLYRGSKSKVLNEFKGVVWDVSIEQFDAYESRIVLKGYSPTILLENNPHITCFTAKDLKKICQDSTYTLSADCKVKIQPTYTGTIKYLTQYKESNFDFLNRLSAEFGEWFYYDGKELNFGKPATSPKEIDLVFGEDVYSLQLKIQIIPSSIKSYSYQFKNDETFISKTPATVNGLGQYAEIAAKESGHLFTEVKSTAMRPKPDNKSDMDRFLKIKKSALSAEHEVVTGKSSNPEIIIGSIATVFISEKSGNNFTKKAAGKYLITSVRHEITEDGEYINQFEGFPSTTEVIPVKDVKKPVAEPQIGIVVNNNDPENSGLIKVRLLWQDSTVTTDWIRVLTLDGGRGGKTGKNRGYVFIPEVDDQVLVGFGYNDPDRPFVLGSFFHGKSAGGGGKDNKIKTISTNSGNTITLNDDKGSMLFEDAKGNSVNLDGGGKILMNCTEEILLKTGDSSITLKKDGTILITGKMKVEVKSDQAVHIEGTSKVDVKSSQAVNVEGTNIAMKANANLELTATANLSAKATANLALEGTAMAKLSSGAMAEISAGIVKIN